MVGQHLRGQQGIVDNINLTRQSMKSSSLMGNIVDFGSGNSASMQQVVDQTISLVADTEKIMKYGIVNKEYYGINIPITQKSSLVQKAKLRAYLADDAIDVSDRLLDRITNISLYNPMMFDSSIENGFNGPFNALRVGFHELGHTASSLSRI